jgi:hypothetical protein
MRKRADTLGQPHLDPQRRCHFGSVGLLPLRLGSIDQLGRQPLPTSVERGRTSARRPTPLRSLDAARDPGARGLCDTFPEAGSVIGRHPDTTLAMHRSGRLRGFPLSG